MLITRHKKLIALGIVLFLYVTLIALIYLNRQQEIRSRASASATLSLSPSSTEATPLHRQINETITVEVMLHPGTNAVSLVNLDVTYDPTILQPDAAQPVEINTTLLPLQLENPLIQNGRIRAKAGIGSDPTKVITTMEKIATLRFKTIKETTQPISINVSNSEILSTGANDNASENVLANAVPAYIVVGDGIGGPIITETPGQCLASAADIMLAIDNSGSMNSKASNTDKTTKFVAAKSAAKLFLNQFSSSSATQIGLKSFASTQYTMSGTVDTALTTTYASVGTKIDALQISSSPTGTCMECVIKKISDHFTSTGRSGYKKAIIFLTDGRANATTTQQYVSDTNPGISVAETALKNAIKDLYTKHKAVVYTIGVGSDVNTTLLKDIAISTGGKYYFPASSEALQTIYDEISDSVTKGAVTGIVFHDENANNAIDSTEQKLSGWKLTLSNPQTNALIATTTTTSSGDFIFDKLCNNKSYRLRLTQQSGWSQTTPKNPSYYDFTITNGAATTEKNFGVSNKPATKLNLTILLHGIGAAGDNANPTNNSLSNKNPNHPEKATSLTLTNNAGNVVATLEGKIKYSSSSGTFLGNVEAMNDAFDSGTYIIKVHTKGYLTKRIGNVQTLEIGKQNTLPPLTLVTGDIIADNKLNILDYNYLIDCYQDFTPAKNCNATKSAQSDINDDTLVNQTDYNLFLRELSVQNGD